MFAKTKMKKLHTFRDLDPAMLRRLEKRILVDTPTAEARCAMLKHYLPPVITDRPRLSCDLDYELLAEVSY